MEPLRPRISQLAGTVKMLLVRINQVGTVKVRQLDGIQSWNLVQLRLVVGQAQINQVAGPRDLILTSQGHLHGTKQNLMIMTSSQVGCVVEIMEGGVEEEVDGEAAVVVVEIMGEDVVTVGLLDGTMKRGRVAMIVGHLMGIVVAEVLETSRMAGAATKTLEGSGRRVAGVIMADKVGML